MYSTVFVITALVSGLGSYARTANAMEVTHPKGVVELFTSQGCYSCPAADKVLGEISQDKTVLGLSWHVDYWDYLGWKDTFASKENTQRQYNYAKSLKERQVYTPQAIINGRSHLVGSHDSEILEKLSAYDQSNQGMMVPINANLAGKSIKILIEENALAKDATLYLVFFNKRHDVRIENGENGGKQLSYYNVVHEVQALGMVQSDGLDMEFPIAEIKKLGFDDCALILQKTDGNGNPAAIIGAAVMADF